MWDALKRSWTWGLLRPVGSASFREGPRNLYWAQAASVPGIPRRMSTAHGRDPCLSCPSQSPQCLPHSRSETNVCWVHVLTLVDVIALTSPTAFSPCHLQCVCPRLLSALWTNTPHTSTLPSLCSPYVLSLDHSSAYLATEAASFWCMCYAVCVLSHVWLCDPMDCSPQGSSVHGIFLTWVSHIAGRFLTIWTKQGSPMCYPRCH